MTDEHEINHIMLKSGLGHANVKNKKNVSLPSHQVLLNK